MPPLFEPGTLRTRIRNTGARALRSGALLPIETRETILTENGIDFPVRVARNLARKPKKATDGKPVDFDPFLPPEPDLLVGEVSATHLAVLNKFHVVPDHLLIVTRAFESQTSRLTLEDFQAWCRCLREFDSLGFYNSGPEAGASQRHKHLQLVPLPLSRKTAPLPLAPLLDPGVGPPFHCFTLRFPQEDRRLPSSTRAMLFHQVYELALEKLGWRPGPDGQLAEPHNLLLTRDGLVVIPRRCESFEGISINGLGFAGSFFVKDEAQVEHLRAAGPIQVLRHVSFPP